ncbi:hypothetical protein DFH27DRAFT_566374 [Peziza echinospora]|nr:hypothetical protein DFH27DRAFT_566374 [Peziza echinospora]
MSHRPSSDLDLIRITRACCIEYSNSTCTFAVDSKIIARAGANSFLQKKAGHAVRVEPRCLHLLYLSGGHCHASSSTHERLASRSNTCANLSFHSGNLSVFDSPLHNRSRLSACPTHPDRPLRLNPQVALPSVSGANPYLLWCSCFWFGGRRDWVCAQDGLFGAPVSRAFACVERCSAARAVPAAHVTAHLRALGTRLLEDISST